MRWPKLASRPSRVGGREAAPTFAILGFTVTRDRIVEIDAIGDPERVRRLAAAVPD